MADVKCTYLIITVLVSLVSIGSALQCYTCTTHKHGDLCVDPFNTSLVSLVNCSQDLNPNPNDTEAQIRCVKLLAHQMGVVGESRVSGIVSTAATRGCILTEHDSCWTDYGATSKIVNCYCDTDGCNAATRHHVTSTDTVALLLLLATLLPCLIS